MLAAVWPQCDPAVAAVTRFYVILLFLRLTPPIESAMIIIYQDDNLSQTLPHISFTAAFLISYLFVKRTAALFLFCV